MLTIREILQQSRVEGDVGIEVEVEADSPLPEDGHPTIWASERDGSLRGYCREYITKGPLPIGAVREEISTLYDHLKDSDIVDSFRAGVHIHVNCQDLTVEQVLNFTCVYYSLEDALMKFCGELREGNHFCLRLKDAEFPLHMLMSVADTGDIDYLRTDNLRYSAMNLRALTIYGSLEFRGMETTSTFSKIPEWAEILVKIRDYSASLSRREAIAYEISAQGPENWVRDILGDELFALINYPEFQADVVTRMRDIQPLIFSRDD